MYITIDVDADEVLREFTDEQLLTEIIERKIESEHDFKGLYESLCAGDKERVFSIAKIIVEKELGRIVP